MAKKPKVMILKTAGTNCDYETGFAFEMAGGEAEHVHINSLVMGRVDFMDYKILAIPGGFSYGDDIASGKIFANELKYKLKSKIRQFLGKGNLVIGICNGFQILVKAGLLPDFTEDGENIDATLTLNDSAKFEDRWVYLKSTEYRVQSTEKRDKISEVKKQKCVWTKNLPEIIYLPVAHGEGKFIPKDNLTLQRLHKEGLIVFQYVDDLGNFAGYPANPNGAVENIAGITDSSGRILGLMPHPERHIHFTQHPRWTRNKLVAAGDGFKIFQNGVEFAKNNLM